MITIKKRVTTQEDAGWRGQLIGLEWQALDQEIIETWEWRSPEVTKGPGHEPRHEGKKGKEVPEPMNTKLNKEDARRLRALEPKPNKAAPKKDTKKTKKTPVDLMQGRQEAKKNKKHKAAMNPKD